MKKIFFIHLALQISILISHSQPSITWQRLYDGPMHYQDFGYSVTPGDSNYIYVTGSTKFWDSLPTFRFYILKLKPNSDTVWTRVLNYNEHWVGGEAFCSVLSNESELVISGDAGHIKTLKIDRNGSVVWLKTYNNYGITYSIQKAIGGYVLCGVNQDLYDDRGFIMKVSSAGDTLWQTFIENHLYQRLFSVDNTIDGGFIAAGDEYVVRLDSLGNLLWEKLFDNYGCVDVRSVKKFGNRYIVGGMGIDSVTPGIGGPCILKLNAQGNIVLRKIYRQNKSELLRSMNILNDKFILCSYHQNNGNDTCYNRIIVTDTSGNIIREKYTTYTGLVDIQSVNVASNNDYLFTGFGDYGNPNSGCDIYVLRTDSLLNFPPNYIRVKMVGDHLPSEFQLYQNYPNPFNPSTKIKVDVPAVGQRHTFDVRMVIYDILGREMEVFVNSELKPGEYRVNWDGTNYPSGIYFYRLTAGDCSETKKMVLLK